MKNNFISELLFPPGCVGCNKRFDIFDSKYKDNDAFCPECRADWEREKLESCPSCGVAAVDCECSPEILNKRYIDCIALVKFGRTLCADRLIYTLKRKNHKRAFTFACEELARRLAAYENRYNIDLSGSIITNVPRKKKSITVYGFDHGRELALGVAALSGCEYKPLISRVGRGKDQKKMSPDERRCNASGKFKPTDELYELTGQTVILVDDVVTSGNTALECIKVLRAQGAEKVILLSIARTPERRVSRRKRRKSKNAEK